MFCCLLLERLLVYTLGQLDAKEGLLHMTPDLCRCMGLCKAEVVDVVSITTWIAARLCVVLHSCRCTCPCASILIRAALCLQPAAPVPACPGNVLTWTATPRPPAICS